jgi:hypothetical protein
VVAFGIVQDVRVPSWLIRSLCSILGHRFGAPRRDGVVMCDRCGILAYSVPAGR